MDPSEMSEEQLFAVRARLEEPPPLIALAERNPGRTALMEYLRRLAQDLIPLSDELSQLQAEMVV